jgi:hypothetical protein
MSELHNLLVARQPDAELERKASKAVRRGLWTQEEIDASRRWAAGRLRIIWHWEVVAEREKQR